MGVKSRERTPTKTRCAKPIFFGGQGEPKELKLGLNSLVCHAFGDHAGYSSTWCGALKDPATYHYKDLPGGKPLSGENLRAAIESSLKPFDSNDWIEKLANCGSTQRNESVNGVVATKAPKTRHYGGSQSWNFWVASGICQFNKGLEYLTKATDELGMEACGITTQHVQRESRKKKESATESGSRSGL